MAICCKHYHALSQEKFNQFNIKQKKKKSKETPESFQRHFPRRLWFLLLHPTELFLLYFLLTWQQLQYLELLAALKCLLGQHENLRQHGLFPPRVFRIYFILFHARESLENHELDKNTHAHTATAVSRVSSAGSGTCSSADLVVMARGQMWFPPPPSLHLLLLHHFFRLWTAPAPEWLTPGPVRGQWKHAMPSLHTVAARHWPTDVLLQTASRAATDSVAGA